MDNLKTRLKFHMRRKGLNPTSLSRKAHLNVTAVRDILQHESTPYPRIDTFAKLCRALDVSPHELSPLFIGLYPYEQDLLDQVHELGKKEEHDINEASPELMACLNKWCEQKKIPKSNKH
jgi:hypothetical protein